MNNFALKVRYSNKSWPIICQIIKLVESLDEIYEYEDNSGLQFSLGKLKEAEE